MANTAGPSPESEGIAQAAAVALVAQPQTAPEQGATAAARTATLEAGGEDGGGRRWFGHAGCRSFFRSQCATLDVGARAEGRRDYCAPVISRRQALPPRLLRSAFGSL
jgi:hypothetical protein